MKWSSLWINFGSGAGPCLNHTSNCLSSLLIPGEPIMLCLSQISRPTRPSLHPFIPSSIHLLNSSLPFLTSAHPYLYPFILSPSSLHPFLGTFRAHKQLRWKCSRDGTPTLSLPPSGLSRPGTSSAFTPSLYNHLAILNIKYPPNFH